MSYASTILADTPTAYYRFGESSGTNALDSSGNGNTATITGGVTLGATGALTNDPNGAYQFDGSTGYVVLPSGVTSAGCTSFSVECWFNTSNFSAHNSRILANSHTDSDNKGFQLYFDGSHIAFNIGGGTTETIAQMSSVGVSNNTWYHLVGVYDGAHVYVYQNAVQGSVVTYTLPIASSSFAINVGRNPAYNGDYVVGEVDEVAIYANIALTLTQVTTHYNARTAFPSTMRKVIGNHRAVGRLF